MLLFAFFYHIIFGFVLEYFARVLVEFVYLVWLILNYLMDNSICNVSAYYTIVVHVEWCLKNVAVILICL